MHLSGPNLRGEKPVSTGSYDPRGMSETSARIAPRAANASVASMFSHRLVRYLIAFAIYVVLTCAYFAPLIAHLNSHALSGFNDATRAIRDYDVIAAAGSTPFTFGHDLLNGAPEGLPLLPQTQIAQPIQASVIWVLRDVVGTVAALNLFILAGFVLTGFAGFALLDWARLGMLPSLFGGFVVAFNPWVVENAMSGAIAFLHGWTLILLLGALTKLRGVRTLRWAALAGLAYGLCFLMASYMGLLATVIVVAFGVVDVGSQSSASERLWTCSLLVVIAGVTLVSLAPGLIALALDHRTIISGLSHSSLALQKFGARPEDYVLPVPRHPVLGTLGHLRRETTIYLQPVFVGYVVLALAALTLVRLMRRTVKLPAGVASHLVLLCAVVIPIAFVASMPRELAVVGVHVPMPSYLIGSVTTFFRVYGRLGYVVEIGLAMLAAVALHQLLDRPRRRVALAIVLVGVAVFEFLPGTLSTVAIGKAPEYDVWLARQPEGIAAHYPMITDTRQSDVLAASELYYQRFTQQPLYEIYGPERRGTREDAIRLQSHYFGNPNTLGILAAEGVRYVVVHDDVYRSQGQAPPTFGAGVRLLRTFGPVRVYRLTAKPLDLERYLKARSSDIADQFGLARPAVSLAKGFYPSETYAGLTTPFQWMRQSGQLDVTNAESGPVRVWIEGFGFSNGVVRRVQLVDPSGHTVAFEDVPTSFVPIRLGPIDVPPGTSRLTLEATPGPTPLEVATRGSRPCSSPPRKPRGSQT